MISRRTRVVLGICIGALSVFCLVALGWLPGWEINEAPSALRANEPNDGGPENDTHADELVTLQGAESQRTVPKQALGHRVRIEVRDRTNGATVGGVPLRISSRGVPIDRGSDEDGALEVVLRSGRYVAAVRGLDWEGEPVTFDVPDGVPVVVSVMPRSWEVNIGVGGPAAHEDVEVSAHGIAVPLSATRCDDTSHQYVLRVPWSARAVEVVATGKGWVTERKSVARARRGVIDIILRSALGVRVRVVDEAKAPIVGCAVVPRFGTAKSYVTEADGEVTVDCCDPATRRLAASLVCKGYESKNVVLRLGGEHELVQEFVLRARSWLGVSAVDYRGASVGGVALQLRDASGRAAARCVTDESGFGVLRAPVGGYLLTAEGGWRVGEPHRCWVGPDPGEAVGGGELAVMVEPLPVVRGTVVDQNGSPISGARIVADEECVGATLGRSNDNGEWAVFYNTGSPPVTLNARADGFQDVEVSARMGHEIVMEPGAGIGGEVSLGGGQGAASWIRLRLLGSGEAFWPFDGYGGKGITVLAESGVWSLQGLAAPVGTELCVGVRLAGSGEVLSDLVVGRMDHYTEYCAPTDLTVNVSDHRSAMIRVLASWKGRMVELRRELLADGACEIKALPSAQSLVIEACSVEGQRIAQSEVFLVAGRATVHL